MLTSKQDVKTCTSLSFLRSLLILFTLELQHCLLSKDTRGHIENKLGKWHIGTNLEEGIIKFDVVRIETPCLPFHHQSIVYASIKNFLKKHISYYMDD